MKTENIIKALKRCVSTSSRVTTTPTKGGFKVEVDGKLLQIQVESLVHMLEDYLDEPE